MHETERIVLEKFVAEIGVKNAKCGTAQRINSLKPRRIRFKITE